MGYEELGVGIDLQKEILKNPSVIDLLISFLYSSAFSHRQRLDLIFPTSIKVFDQNNIEHSFVLQVLPFPLFYLSLTLDLSLRVRTGPRAIIMLSYNRYSNQFLP
jgi:hypothetical protein